jgi:hypothetical protein
VRNGGGGVKTKFGTLTIEAVLSRIGEIRQTGRKAFLAKYANSRDSRSTWISFEGDYYPAKAIYAASLNPKRMPAEFNTSDTYVFSQALGLELISVEDGLVHSDRSAIDDLDELNAPILPGRQDFSGTRYVRDPKVRAAVLARAKGKCEHCRSEGFLMTNGARYLETHHIIALAKQGPDSMQNVIALCPLDHRRAHYSTEAVELESSFVKALASMKS